VRLKGLTYALELLDSAKDWLRDTLFGRSSNRFESSEHLGGYSASWLTHNTNLVEVDHHQ
jgi:hypothetical protein